MLSVFGNSSTVLTIKTLLTDLLTFGIKSIQFKLWPKYNETLQIIDFARFFTRLEFPPSNPGRIVSLRFTSLQSSALKAKSLNLQIQVNLI